MPAHPDEKTAVVAVVGRPPVLRGGHYRDQVGLERVDVEFGELLGVVEVLAERVGLRDLGVQPRDVDLIGPPVLVRAGSLAFRRRRVDRRILAFAAFMGCIG